MLSDLMKLNMQSIFEKSYINKYVIRSVYIEWSIQVALIIYICVHMWDIHSFVQYLIPDFLDMYCLNSLCFFFSRIVNLCVCLAIWHTFNMYLSVLFYDCPTHERVYERFKRLTKYMLIYFNIFLVIILSYSTN